MPAAAYDIVVFQSLDSLFHFVFLSAEDNCSNSDEKFIQLFQQVGTIKAACKALEERALHELESGKEIPGYKLVSSRTRRRWVKNAEDFLRGKKVPKKYMYEQKLVSFTKLEKNPKYKTLVEQLTEKPEGNPTVVPDSDSRPALPPPVEQDFEVLG